MNNTYKWDIFLSHASEDKADFVHPLAEKLIANNIKAWYDEFEIKWGDSLRESIDEGLRLSRFAIVVLSKNYFKKSWTANELNGYFSFDNKDAKRILPIWHGVNEDEVRQFSPILSERLSADSKSGIDFIVDKVKKRLNLNFTHEDSPVPKTKSILAELINWETLSAYTNFRFGLLGINEFWQAAFLEDIASNKNYKTIIDIDNSVVKASIAVAYYAMQNPTLFKTGTDFITKSVGFVDADFRQKHNFGSSSYNAFESYSYLLRVD